MEELAKELQSHTIGRANQVRAHSPYVKQSTAWRTRAAASTCAVHSNLAVGAADVHGSKRDERDVRERCQSESQVCLQANAA